MGGIVKSYVLESNKNEVFMQGVDHYVAMMDNKDGKVSGHVVLQYGFDVEPIDCDEKMTTKEREQLLIDKALMRRAEGAEHG